MTKAFRQKNPKWIKQLAARTKAKGDKVVAVGYPKEKAVAYGDGTPVLLVAAVHNYGLGVLKRPFMDDAALEMRKMFVEKCRAEGARINSDDFNLGAFLKKVGILGEAHVVAQISDGGYEPNAPATVARKRSDHPLIDTGHLMKSVRSQVRKK